MQGIWTIKILVVRRQTGVESCQNRCKQPSALLKQYVQSADNRQVVTESATIDRAAEGAEGLLVFQQKVRAENICIGFRGMEGIVGL